MRRAVDEVGVGDDCGGEAHDGAVEAHDEDLWVRGKSLCDVEVEGDKGLEELLAGFAGVGGIWSAYGDVCATVYVFFLVQHLISSNQLPFLLFFFHLIPLLTHIPFIRQKSIKRKRHLRGKEASLAEENSDIDLIVRGHFSHRLRELIVLRLVERIELLLVCDGDDGDAAAVLD